jgi:hypothetical protein
MIFTYHPIFSTFEEPIGVNAGLRNSLTSPSVIRYTRFPQSKETSEKSPAVNRLVCVREGRPENEGMCSVRKYLSTVLATIGAILALYGADAWCGPGLAKSSCGMTKRSVVVAPARLCKMPVAPRRICAYPTAPDRLCETVVAPQRICGQVVAPRRLCSFPVSPQRICSFPVAPQSLCQAPVPPRRSCTVYLRPENPCKK